MGFLSDMMERIRKTLANPQEMEALAQAKDPKVREFLSRRIWRGVPKAKRPGHRPRGTYGRYQNAWPQIIRKDTAERWGREGRKTRNYVVVSR